MAYEIRYNPTILPAITTTTRLFLCWMTWVTAFMREALVMAFVRALYHWWFTLRIHNIYC